MSDFASEKPDFYRYTFITRKCCDDLTLILNDMRTSDVMPVSISTKQDFSARTKVVVDCRGNDSWHKNFVRSMFKYRTSILYFDQEEVLLKSRRELVAA